MNALQQFLQAASNEAAGAVSGPVDLIGMGLRKLGVPVPRNALMSSEWMKQNGLMQDVPQSGASLAGQTFGLLSPVVAAAKAPQIARGLLQMGDNAAAQVARPKMGQMGAIAWHGSPHKFDAFDSSKIGTGEGAQAYGHGLYLAESPAVADGYRATLGGAQTTLDGKPLSALNMIQRDAADYATTYGGKQQALDVLNSKIKSGSKFDDLEYLSQVRDLLAKADLQINTGALYKVDLPDEKIARMLDWDKPLSQQAPAVTRHFKDMHELNGGKGYMNADGGYTAIGVGSSDAMTGKDLVEFLSKMGGGRSDASSLLRQQGIPGIRYLDGGSRSAGAGSSNFVVFPGEENALKILERNGKPIR